MPDQLSFPICHARKIPVLLLALALWFFSGVTETEGSGIFSSNPETLNHVAQSIAGELGKSHQASRPRGSGGLKPVIYVSRNYFFDPHTKATYPLSSYLADELRTALAATGLFDLTTDADFDSDYVLTGNYHREKSNLIITCWLKQMMVRSDGQKVVVDAASAREELEKSHWDPQWFTDTVESRMRFLMARLEEKCASDLLGKERSRVVVERFRFQDEGLFSPFSAYVGSCITDHLTRSKLLVPLEPRDGRIIDETGIKEKNIVPTSTRGGTLAALSQSACSLTGTYWPKGEDVEVKAKLITPEDEILASASVLIPGKLINPQWLALPQKKDTGFMRAYEGFRDRGPGEAPFEVEILTTRGKNNLTYAKGEKIVFLLKVNRNAHVRIFNRGADGEIYRIFPNDFHPDDRVPAGRAVMMPGKGYGNFAFEVRAPFGNEIAKVYASDRPLEELPGKALGLGFKKMTLSAKEIQEAFTGYALKHGIALGQDDVVIRTVEVGDDER